MTNIFAYFGRGLQEGPLQIAVTVVIPKENFRSFSCFFSLSSPLTAAGKAAKENFRAFSCFPLPFRPAGTGRHGCKRELPVFFLLSSLFPPINTGATAMRKEKISRLASKNLPRKAMSAPTREIFTKYGMIFSFIPTQAFENCSPKEKNNLISAESFLRSLPQ